MANVKLKYIWLDGCQPEPNLRSKTKILDEEAFGATLDEIFMWYYGGSSTR